MQPEESPRKIYQRATEIKKIEPKSGDTRSPLRIYDGRASRQPPLKLVKFGKIKYNKSDILDENLRTLGVFSKAKEVRLLSSELEHFKLPRKGTQKRK